MEGVPSYEQKYIPSQVTGFLIPPATLEGNISSDSITVSFSN
jgi:hypothetical protein